MSSVEVDEVVIKGRRYIPADSVPAPIVVGTKKIVVLQRGWIVIGDVSENQETGLTEIRNACTIRRWGTTKGIGQLVDGPTTNTILDKIPGLVEVHPLTIIQRISVNASKWN